MAVHDLSYYTQWIRGGCLSACDRLVDCSCQQDEPMQDSASNQQDSTSEESEPVQQPEPSPEPPRNPGETG